MADPNKYNGALALGYSKYAEPSKKMDHAIPTPAQVFAVAGGPAQQSVAALTQVATLSKRPASTSASIAVAKNEPQPALEQASVFKEEIETHVANELRRHSDLKDKLMDALERVREAVPKDTPTVLENVEKLWTEIEQLLEALDDTADALPEFIEKHQKHMSLHYSTVVNGVYRDVQEEASILNKKVDMQAKLIFELQQAFEEYRARMKGTTAELTALRERYSRLTLEKGNCKTELEMCEHLLAKEQWERSDMVMNYMTLQQELTILTWEIDILVTKVEASDNVIVQTKEQAKESEKKITDHFLAELKGRDAKMKELQEISHHAQVRFFGAVQKVGCVREEHQFDKNKMKVMVTEKATMLAKDAEQTEKISSIEAEVKRYQSENAKLVERTKKFQELAEEKDKLFKENSKLVAMIAELQVQIETSKKDKPILQQSVADANNLVKDANAKVKEQAAQITLLQENHEALTAKLVKLEAANGARRGEKNEVFAKDLEKEKAKTASLERAVKQWTEVAMESYNKFKDMVALEAKIEQQRKDARAKDEQVQRLELELAEARAKAASAKKTNNEDAVYWKGKYESLLASVSD